MYRKKLLKYRDQYGHYVLFEVQGVTQKLRQIKAGSFVMGAATDELECIDQKERPQHLVTLTSDFWLADTACTEALWQAVMGRRKAHFEGLNLPAVNISAEDLQAFLDKVHALSGYFSDIPTEAQWEYACRAGTTTTAFWWGNNISPKRANYSQWTYKGYSAYEEIKTPIKCPHAPVPVNTYPPNPWGLHICGNVWEWCKGYRTYTEDAVIDPPGDDLTGGRYRAIRGGSYDSRAGSLRAADRGQNPGNLQNALGFRLMLPVLEPSTFVPKPKPDKGITHSDTIADLLCRPDHPVTDQELTELRHTLLHLLRVSLSLDMKDKLRVLNALSELRYGQLTLLIRGLNEEFDSNNKLAEQYEQEMILLREMKAKEWKTILKTFTKIKGS